MYKFSEASQENLEQCHPDIQKVFNHVGQRINIRILVGRRNEADQNKAFHEGRSKRMFPESMHNKTPSQAVDAAPYPIDFNNLNRFYYLAGYVIATADMMYEAGEISHKIRGGHDWDMDNDITDQTFMDLMHFELAKENDCVG